METRPQFVEIPPELAALIGQPDPGTRIFRREGSDAEEHEWFLAICKFIGPTVSPGGVAMFAKVSRPGVYKRLKAGKLTAFCFHETSKAKTLFGGAKKKKALPWVYIPVAECQAWREELQARVARIEAVGRITAQDKAAFAETDGEFTRKMDNFLLYDPADKGKRGVVYVHDL